MFGSNEGQRFIQDLLQVIYFSLGPGSSVGEKEKTNRKNIGKRSEPSVFLGRGKGRRSLETCLWRHCSMIPYSGIMLWLVKCLHHDSFAVLLTVSHSFNITLLQFRKKDLTWISSKQHKFLCETFGLSLGFKNGKKYSCDLLQKEKEEFKISSFSYPFLL